MGFFAWKLVWIKVGNHSEYILCSIWPFLNRIKNCLSENKGDSNWIYRKGSVCSNFNLRAHSSIRVHHFLKFRLSMVFFFINISLEMLPLVRYTQNLTTSFVLTKFRSFPAPPHWPPPLPHFDPSSPCFFSLKNISLGMLPWVRYTHNLTTSFVLKEFRSFLAPPHWPPSPTLTLHTKTQSINHRSLKRNRARHSSSILVTKYEFVISLKNVAGFFCVYLLSTSYFH